MDLWNRLAVCILLALLAPLPEANANRLQVGPTLIELAAERQAEAIWLSNSGSQPMPVQVRAFRWSQDQDGEHLEPTTDLVVSPAQATILPGQRQMVRILRRAPAQPGEQAYRLIVDELSLGEATPAQANSLQFRLRYSVPVFLAATAPGNAELSASLVLAANADGPPILLVTNAGAGRAQLAEVSLLAPNGLPQGIAEGLLGYVLAGRTMRWPLKLPSAPEGAEYRLQFRLNAEPRLRTVPVRVVRRP